ncbi:MAG TPA: YIP1 family protein [Pyrinomonadaceae bacterium]|nr:YIP1 family protein [Pyrinomonadaceae bacterium]
MSALTEPVFPPPPPPPPTPPTEPKAPRPTYLWPFAIGFFVLGLLFLVGSLTKLSPDAWFTAIAFCFVGLLIFGLSFIPLPAVPQKEEPLSFLQKVTGIFFEPSRVFRNLREHPLWVGAFILMGLLSATYSYAFVQRITPERIVEQARQQTESMGNLAGTPERREEQLTRQLEAMKHPVTRVGAALNAVPATFLFIAAVAGLSLLGMLAFGGRMNFWQALAVTTYGAVPIVVIQKVLGLIILYLKAPEDLHVNLNRDTTLQDNLGILVTPADQPVLFVLLSVIGITSFYGIWLRAKGMHLGATRASSGAGWGVSISLLLIGLFLGLTFAVLMPGIFA